MDVEKRGGGKELLQVRKASSNQIFLLSSLIKSAPDSLLFSLLVASGAASVPEAGEAALQSHTSHPGSQGGHEGQSLAEEKELPTPSHAVHRRVPTI